jgi:hypothetical protein
MITVPRFQNSGVRLPVFKSAVECGHEIGIVRAWRDKFMEMARPLSQRRPPDLQANASIAAIEETFLGADSIVCIFHSVFPFRFLLIKSTTAMPVT